MTNANDVRRAHDILNELGARTGLSQEQEKLLRSFLPELPSQKTLEELRREVYDAWVGTEINEWPDDIHGDLEIWLHELHEQLKGLEHYAEPFNPVHPEFLETEADYENAPEGTIVAQHGFLTWVKKGANDWTCSVGAVGNYSMAQSMPRRVWRWGDK